MDRACTGPWLPPNSRAVSPAVVRPTTSSCGSTGATTESRSRVRRCRRPVEQACRDGGLAPEAFAYSVKGVSRALGIQCRIVWNYWCCERNEHNSRSEHTKES